MGILRSIKGAYLGRKIAQAKQMALLQPVDSGIQLDDFGTSLNHPTSYYLRCFQQFHSDFPASLVRHREYFTKERRGFGEDAFHVMWRNLVRRFRPEKFLEIGVYRGQTLSLVSLVANECGYTCDVTGISPFESIGDSVSNYLSGLDYYNDTLANFKPFNLPSPNLLRAYSTDPDAVDFIKSQDWDIIYIDGNHDYEIVLKDWQVCSESVKPGGLIVMDDSGLTTNYQPPRFATGGHPGPSRLASEIDKAEFNEILQVGHNRVFQKTI